MPEWLAHQAVIVKQADLHTNMLSQVITAEYLGNESPERSDRPDPRRLP